MRYYRRVSKSLRTNMLLGKVAQWLNIAFEMEGTKCKAMSSTGEARRQAAPGKGASRSQRREPWTMASKRDCLSSVIWYYPSLKVILCNDGSIAAGYNFNWQEGILRARKESLAQVRRPLKSNYRCSTWCMQYMILSREPDQSPKLLEYTFCKQISELHKDLILHCAQGSVFFVYRDWPALTNEPELTVFLRDSPLFFPFRFSSPTCLFDFRVSIPCFVPIHLHQVFSLHFIISG